MAMASNSSFALLLLLLLFVTSVVALFGSSDDQINDEFLECLSRQLARSNSSFDIVYTPGSSSYEALRDAWNLRPPSTSPKRPIAIITPSHESEIQAAVYCSRETGLQIKVRSGGHDYEGLSHTSKSPFAVVDMRNLHSVSIDTEGRTAWVESGANLGQLYYAIAQKSKILAFPAGTCPTVGVGGHFSGGGYGMISRKHALSADHIIDAKLINADGQVLDRRSMGEDLFWAIRGGGGTSFGIIVAFKIELVVVPETVTVFNITKTLEQNATQLVHRWQYVANKIDERLLIRLFLDIVKSPTSGNTTISVSFASLFLGGIDDLLTIMQERFPELGLMREGCITMSWIESTLYFAYITDMSMDALLTPPIQVYYLKGKSDFVREPIPTDGLRRIWKFLLEDAEIGNGAYQLQFSPYGGVLNSYSESDIPFPHRSGNIFIIHYAVVWLTADPDNVVAKKRMKWIRRIYDDMAPYVSKSPRAAYFNYRDLDIGYDNEGNTSYAQASVWGPKYFRGNFERLVRVKTKFDPFNFFRNEQSIPPLMTLMKQGQGLNLFAKM